MSQSLNSQSALVNEPNFRNFSFPEGDLNGPVLDEQGQPVYELTTEREGLFNKHTAIQKEGKLVGDIAWGSTSFQGRTLTLNGRDYGELLTKKTINPLSSERFFSDENGRELHWKGTEVVLVERYRSSQTLKAFLVVWSQ